MRLILLPIATLHIHTHRHDRHHHDNLSPTFEASIALSNLMFGVHPSCQWYIETTKSEWSRLIQEMHETSAEGSESTFLDLAPGADGGR